MNLSDLRLFISSRFMDINVEGKEWLEPAKDRVQWKVSNLRVLLLVSYFVTVKRGARGSSVGTATLYGLNGPGLESRWGFKFFGTHPDRSLGPTSLLFIGNQVSFPRVKPPVRGVEPYPFECG